MPSKIRVLTEHTINKIAAGEVIENPASVVKELVENSLDAGATDICVEIKGGGRQLIRITDDGSGMNSDDALLCLERHATSKIRAVEDIHDVTTMGFRGEALPSIASISKFMLLTCPKPETPHSNQEISLGSMVMVDGGKIISCSPAARSPGTTIEVKSLFFNVPVRKKFLKSPTVDTNEILKMISQIALGYPHVKLQLINDSKILLTATGSQNGNFTENLNKRIEAVLGPDYLQHCLPLKHVQAGLSLEGVIGLPSYTRHNRTGQFLFINSRGVFSPLVAYAIKEGYGSALASGRHPVFVLHLSLTGGLVDVNVHPQKREVRLRQEHVLKDLIIKGVEQALQSAGQSTLSSFPQINPVFAKAFAQSDSLHTTLPNDEWVFRPKALAPWNKADAPVAQCELPVIEDIQVAENHPIHLPLPKSGLQSTCKDISPQSDLMFSMPAQLALPQVIATIPRYILLNGSQSNTMLLENRTKSSSKPGGLLLIDQKAAHARVIFEKLQDNVHTQSLALQALLIPYTLEVSAFEAATLRACLTNLNNMGIHIQEFGNNTFLIDALPQIFGSSNLQQLVTDIVQALRETHSEQPLQDEKNKRIALAASRSALSIDRQLSLEEAQALVNQLCGCRHPFQCPQGKPTMVQLSSEELAKYFNKL